MTAGGVTDGGDPVQQQPALGELLARPGQRVDGAGDVGQRGRPAAALADPRYSMTAAATPNRVRSRPSGSASSMP